MCLIKQLRRNRQVRKRPNTLIRYADDIVVLCRSNAQAVLGEIKTVLSNMELTLNEEKTKIVDAKRESFEFLGFEIKHEKSKRTGNNYILIKPSRKAIKRFKAEIKSHTGRNSLIIPKEVMIDKLNKIARGWSNYFHYGNCGKDLAKAREYLDMRVRIYLREKHARNGQGYSRYPYKYLHDTLGLYKIPTYSPWTRNAKA